MKRFTVALVLLFIARPLAESGGVPPTEDARLERAFKDYLDTELKHRPLEATRLGDHRFDDLLDDVSPKARAAKESLKNPPKVLAETAIRQNRGAIAFYESGIYQLTGETPQLSDLRSACKKVVPLLRDYQKFLEDDLLPRANGEWRIGKEKF